jgi:glycosyltransferase involved in cell wall biosynthesis
MFSNFPSAPLGKTGWPWLIKSNQLSTQKLDESTWPRISVVIPSFNQGAFFEETIRSVLLQGYPNLEFIVVDGGSTDEGIEILEKYKPWFAYCVSEPDHGQSHAINKGFAKCTGDIVTFLGGDDTYAPGTLFDVAGRFIANRNVNLGAIVGAFQVQDEYSNSVGDVIPSLIHFAGPIDLTLVHPSQYRLHQVSTFYARVALEKVGFWVREDLRYVMDRELLYRVCRSFSILTVNEVYGVFRKHEMSKSESSIIQFADEFSSLYLGNMSSEADKDQIRRKNARYFRASGFIKFARMSNNLCQAVMSLLKALILNPAYLFNYTYLSTWKKLFQKSGVK